MLDDFRQVGDQLLEVLDDPPLVKNKSGEPFLGKYKRILRVFFFGVGLPRDFSLGNFGAILGHSGPFRWGDGLPGP